MTDATQVVFRLIHLFTGIFWVGTTFLAAGFLFPALRASGDSGKAVTDRLFLVQKLGVAVPVTAVLTVLSGGAMYWRNISLSGGAWARSRPAMVYGVGAVAALIGLVIGKVIVGGGMEQAVNIRAGARTAGRTLTTAEVDAADRLEHRALFGAKLSAALLAVTVVAMAVGRYVS